MKRLARLLRSLEARTVAVLLVAILATHAGALALYRQSAIAAADEAFAERVATQLVLAREALARRPTDQREAEARALSTPHFDLGWARASPIDPAKANRSFLWSLRDRITTLEPALADAGLVLDFDEPGDAVDFQELKGSLGLPDGTQLVFRSAHSPNLTRLGPWALFSTIMAGLVGLAAVILMHRTARPLRTLAAKTDEITIGPTVPIPEAGPDETRSIARALNAMQTRIQRLMGERMQALAAVSHDLRTPITRMRLRLDGVADEGERRAMAADLDDMQAMIDSTLAYLRDETDPESPQAVNVASILATLVDDASDAGARAVYSGPSRVVANLRPVSIKRALANLVDNALRYGGSVEVGLVSGETDLTIRIVDTGPGIATAYLERVFEPFKRLEQSRNRNSGGTGLGLTIARRAIEREGGTISLANRPEGGLIVELRLPLDRPAPAGHITLQG